MPIPKKFFALAAFWVFREEGVEPRELWFVILGWLVELLITLGDFLGFDRNGLLGSGHSSRGKNHLCRELLGAVVGCDDEKGIVAKRVVVGVEGCCC